jgi:hypothetical protein
LLDQSEGKLLLQEAREYIAEPPLPTKEGESLQNGNGKRAESKKKISGYTGDRLFREEPRRYKLIASMLAEGTVPLRAIMRTCLCDRRTVASVERREAETIPMIRQKLTKRYGRIAAMTAERLEEEVPKMNHSTLAVCSGIATDKLLTLTGDANNRIDLTIHHQGPNIFERMAQLAAEMAKGPTRRATQAIVIDPPAMSNSNSATAGA